MFVQWRTDQIIVLDDFELTMGFHSVDVLNAGEVHSMILKPNGNYEYSTEQIVTRLLPPPYDTNCVSYDQRGLHPLYPAYTTQTVSITCRIIGNPVFQECPGALNELNLNLQLCNFECQRQITRSVCNCTPTGYPFRNKLNENVCSRDVTGEVSVAVSRPKFLASQTRRSSSGSEFLPQFERSR